MKKNKIVLMFFLILFGMFSIIGFAANDTLEIIKIGLQYPKEGLDKSKTVEIFTETAFEFGEIIADQYMMHFQIEGLKKFTFDLDTNYHAVMGPFVDYETSNQALSKINRQGYVVKGKAYYVYSNGSSTQGDAQTILNTYAALGYPTFIAEPNTQLILVKDSQIRFAYLSNEGDFLLAPTNGGLEKSTFNFKGLNYRGGIGAKNQYLNDISIINYVRMHEYLYGVVPREMSKTWPIEALKAQAVVARNYAVANQNKFIDYGFNLDNTVASQVYGGYDWEGPISNQAVDETKGMALYYEDTLVNGYYHSNSGGYTENSENVWSQALPYLKGVYDPFSKEDTFALTYTPVMIEKKLEQAGYTIGSLINFEISDYTQNHRVLNARFQGTEGQVDLPKETIRKVFGHNEIRSTLLEVQPDNTFTLTNGESFVNTGPSQVTILSGNNIITTSSEALVISNGVDENYYDLKSTAYRVTGSGWGHGLGMSQWGAKTMAEQGYTFEEILTFYYQGTHIQ